MKTVKPHLTVSEAARRLGVSRVTAYSLAKAGSLPVDETGRIPRAALDELELAAVASAHKAAPDE